MNAIPSPRPGSGYLESTRLFALLLARIFLADGRAATQSALERTEDSPVLLAESSG